MNLTIKTFILSIYITLVADLAACIVHNNQTLKYGTTEMEPIEKTNPKNQNIELGKVSWYRNYQEALQKSKETGKPVLLFFQEIPGCATCVNYGRNVLSHPLMVDLIENEFIPLAIYNNRPGADAEILRRYNEPSWNNPVAHFIDETGKDIIPKLEDNYEPASMLLKIREALAKKNIKEPGYVSLLEKDITLLFGYTKTKIYETPCFWSGETSLAQQKSVISTEAGFIDSKEVVKIVYDPAISTDKELDEYAMQQGFYTIESSRGFRADKDPQYYLKQSAFRYLPLSPVQRTKINQAIPYGVNAELFLSPTQLSWYKNDKLKKLAAPDNYTKDIITTWGKLNESLQQKQ
jgi:hypothetical protein